MENLSLQFMKMHHEFELTEKYLNACSAKYMNAIKNHKRFCVENIISLMRR